MKKCIAPTLVLAAEKDCLFPDKNVIKRAETMIPNCTTYLLTERGHIHSLSSDEKQKITTFLRS